MHASVVEELFDGELVVVGPDATLRLTGMRMFKGKKWIKSSILSEEEEDELDEQTIGEGESTDEGEEDWDRISSDVPPPLTSLALLRTRLSLPSALPPTLTHLALLALTRPIYIHHIPPVCPLIEVLDLSYNSWLADSSGESTFDRIEWKRWRNLRILGLRECRIVKAKTTRVNEQRWTDVEIFGLETV
ncbi:hypothetical protein BDY19DRAFT_918393 [Irpex rosettiformis]|uniref:Uncharacterized protein n=1 Tax=Irpex rosettiformis TaxID=378272 RepID=A0ACB8UH60_9APHY|nr:hypothetical protein BDY19DRAFT_918393 [Irpex rosettiformis]